MTMAAEVPTIPAGQTVDGKYEIVRLLGRGGMGAVYEAVHTGTGRRVALKVILSDALAKDDGVLARFQREARASGAIDSAHVVQVLDTGIEPSTGNPYMVMEHLTGEDVYDLIRRLGPLPPMLALRIVAQACLGLQRAHDAGIVHRDIKAANIYLARRGGEVTVKLLDFGIAKVRADRLAANEDQHLTATGSMIGSPLYMSPEQARGMKTLDSRSDIWSLGVVLYEALTGAPPNADKETLGDLILAICMDEPRPVQDSSPWVSYELASVVTRTLARQPADRFATAADMHAALTSLSPGGFALTEDMLVALPEGMRSFVASRPPPATPAPYQHTPPPSVGTHDGGNTSPFASTAAMPEGAAAVSAAPVQVVNAQASTGSVAILTPTPPPPAKSRRWPLVLAAVAMLGGGGALYQAFLHRPAAKSDPAMGAALVQGANTALPPPPAPSPSPLLSELAAPSAKAAELAVADSGVAPAHAKAEHSAKGTPKPGGAAAPVPVPVAEKPKPAAAKPAPPAAPAPGLGPEGPDVKRNF